MNKKMKKWWLVAAISVPFILLIGLHIGIALGRYFNIDFNPPSIDAATWLTFAGSYLGGVMTLVGVMLTLRYERKVYQHRGLLENIDKEKERLGRTVCEINIYTPSAIFQQINSLQVMQDGYNEAEIATIRHLIIEEMEKINKLRCETDYFTGIFAMTAGCISCKKPCKIQTILPEFQKIYDEIGKCIYETLQEIEQYIIEFQINAFCNAQIKKYRRANEERQKQGQLPQYSEAEIEEYRNKIVALKPRQDKIYTMLTEISRYNQKEIIQLSSLAKEYIVIKQQNAYKQCFTEKQE